MKYDEIRKRGWKILKLKDICIQITDGTHKTPNYVEKGTPFISTQNLKPFSKTFDFSQYKKFISQEEHNFLIKRCNPEKGDILLSKCGTIGRAQVVRVDYTFSLFVGVALLKLNKKEVSCDFLEQLLNFPPIVKKMKRSSPGSTRKTLTIRAIENLLLPLPPLPEQKKIAEILGSVDEAIEITDKEIEKVERLKKGLMQELLTRGIGHKKFKKTEIGIIPEEWEVVRIGNIGNVVTGTTPSTKIIEYWGTDIPFVTPSDFKKTKYVKFTERKVSKTGAKIGKLIPPKSVMVVCIASVGEVSLASSMCITNQQINSIVCKENIDPEYIYYVLSGRKGILQSWAGITTTPIIKKSLFEKFPIPLPPLPEQGKIAEILSGVDELLETLRNRKGQLQRLKKGLMEDLLTGKRRVKINGNP